MGVGGSTVGVKVGTAADDVGVATATSDGLVGVSETGGAGGQHAVRAKLKAKAIATTLVTGLVICPLLSTSQRLRFPAQPASPEKRSHVGDGVSSSM